MDGRREAARAGGVPGPSFPGSSVPVPEVSGSTGAGAGGVPARGGAASLRPPSLSPQARTLLDRADGLLAEAAGARDAADRFRTAYLAALRGAAAALGGRRDDAVRRRPGSRSAWVLLARAEPELADWAEYLAGHSATRAAIEAGISRTVTWGEADRFHREVSQFLTAVEEYLRDGLGRRPAAGSIVGRSA